ncbi:hypothetical protein AACH06_02720 [Ideonella sp. DXS29W]|uniref:Transmembrane protein n=1 Tax=Ideonella lacteola TaxID=2984193 RepID=A0ABU9BID7_9BURK
MIVPDFWAEARRQHRAQGRQITVRRFGWSTVSAQDAAAMAERRADEALSRLLAGEKLPRREPKVPYNGAAGVPIREEVLERHGEDVITRNAYGARCLNTPDALFADVDFALPPARWPFIAALTVLAVLSVAVGAARGSSGLVVGLLVVSLILAAPLATLARRLGVASLGGAEAVARRRLARFLAAHPEWNVRVYRTPAGLRLLATHRPCAPGDAEVAQFFDAVGTDPVYVRMCLNQHCFRARLTAKPWRIGMPGRMRPRPGVWPVSPERAPIRAQWVAEYEALAAQYSSCRFIEAAGSGTIHPRIAEVVALHDRECRSHGPTAAMA